MLAKNTAEIARHEVQPRSIPCYLKFEISMMTTMPLQAAESATSGQKTGVPRVSIADPQQILGESIKLDT